MKRMAFIFLSIILSSLIISCKKDKKEVPVDKMNPAEAVAYLKTLNTKSLKAFILKQKKDAKSKAGFAMLKEGLRLEKMGKDNKAFEYLYFANLFLPFKAENNYNMAKLCARLNKAKLAVYFLKKASEIDRSYARRSVEENDFAAIRDSEHWRSLVYKINEASLKGKWKGNQEGVYLTLYPNKSWHWTRIKDSLVKEEKRGSWSFYQVKLPEGTMQARITLAGDISETYVINVENIEGFTMYKLANWLGGKRFFADFKKKSFSESQTTFE